MCWLLQYERRVAEAGSPLPGRIAVVLGDGDVAGAYIHSERAESEFTGTTAPFRTAVAIGRFHQDALRELCSMWQLHGRSAHSTDLRAAGVASLGDDLLALTLHPLQSEVTPTQLLKGAERVMVETVNAVGVDINQALAHDHVAPMLQFLCGMGPRKATDLVQKLGKFKQVARDDLRADGNVGERVYRNLAGFVWIAPNRARRDVHALENTRIHPELYEHAKTVSELPVCSRCTTLTISDDAPRIGCADLLQRCGHTVEEGPIQGGAVVGPNSDRCHRDCAEQTPQEGARAHRQLHTAHVLAVHPPYGG